MDIATTTTSASTTTTTATAVSAAPPAGFARRVSFDNYAPFQHFHLSQGSAPASARDPSASLAAPPSHPTPRAGILKHSGGDGAGNADSGERDLPAKERDHARSGDDASDKKAIDKSTTDHNRAIAVTDAGSHNFSTQSHPQEQAFLSSSLPTDISPTSSASKIQNSSQPPITTGNVFSNNYSLQPPTTNNSSNVRKKSYQELSDSELLALDSQFSFKPVDIQKSYGFSPTSRLSYSSISDSDKNSLNHRADNHFKNLSPNAILKEYPTKPIITKHSICVNFKHDNLSNADLNHKFYLILLSKKSASLTSLNYYMNNISSKGDSIIICCSLSTTILGNDKSKLLEDFVANFTQTILAYLQSNKYPINITFEFFKSYTYFDEVLNLYQPNLVIVGTNNDKTKSTSLTTSEKKLISLVYVGNDQLNQSESSSVHRKSEVSFRLPFKDKSTLSTTKNPIINISKSPGQSSDEDEDENEDEDEDEEEGNDDDENDSNLKSLSKQKTNDTIVSSLFDNLIETPALDFDPSSLSCDLRRKSMLEVSNSDFSSSCAISDDPLDSKVLLSPLMRNRTANSGNSFGSMDSQLKDRQQLFEKYNRRLSQVNVDPKSKPKVQDHSIPPTEKKTGKEQKSGFFKKIFGRS